MSPMEMSSLSNLSWFIINNQIRWTVEFTLFAVTRSTLSSLLKSPPQETRIQPSATG